MTVPRLGLTYAHDDELEPLDESTGWSEIREDPADPIDEAPDLALAIPDPGREGRELGPESPAGWNLSSLVRGVVAIACVPLLLHAELARASPPALPDPTEPVSDPTPPPTPVVVQTLAPTMASPPTPAVAPPTGSPAQASTAVWTTLSDHRVTLELADGSRVRGLVLGVANLDLVVARESDGTVVTVAMADVRAVKVEVPPAPGTPPPQTGAGSIVMGSIATTIGGALTLAGAVLAVNCAVESGKDDGAYYSYVPGCNTYTLLPLGIIGAVNLGLGIPLLVHGLKKRKRYRAEHDPKPAVVSGYVAPSRLGVSTGVGIRF